MSLSQLTIFKDPNQNMMLMQNSWSRGLNVLLKNPALQSSILKNVALVAGTNTINTLLGQDLQGWSIVRQRGPASIYDEQDSNPRPNLTLILVSSAAVTVDILVF
jgi:hypothetical protein